MAMCASDLNTFTQDPDALLDYVYDWKALTNGSGASDWLATGETISSIVITSPSGITDDAGTITGTGTTVTVWISGGTAGTDYDVVCSIVTSDAREDDRTIVIQIRER